MTRVTIRLDSAGIRTVLTDNCRELVGTVTRRIAAQIPGSVVEFRTTDRAVGRVHVDNFRQSRDGALTRAAASLGLEVKRYRGKA